MTPAARPDFDRRAPHYDAHAGVQHEAAAWLAAWLPPRIPGPALELGAGTGLFTRHLARRADELRATDISPRMVEAGRLQLPAVAWSQADAAAPPADAAYRWIFSCSVIQWLPDPAAAFHRWHQTSAPGARLLAGWFIRGTLADFLQTCPETAPFVWRDAGTWLQLAAENGWRPLRHETRTFLRLHPDTLSMLRDIHRIGAVVPHRFHPGELRRILRRHDQLHRGPDGLRTTFTFLRLEAARS